MQLSSWRGSTLLYERFRDAAKDGERGYYYLMAVLVDQPEPFGPCKFYWGVAVAGNVRSRDTGKYADGCLMVARKLLKPVGTDDQPDVYFDKTEGILRAVKPLNRTELGLVAVKDLL